MPGYNNILYITIYSIHRYGFIKDITKSTGKCRFFLFIHMFSTVLGDFYAKNNDYEAYLTCSITHIVNNLWISMCRKYYSNIFNVYYASNHV
jgi:hypothetical protein